MAVNEAIKAAGDAIQGEACTRPACSPGVCNAECASACCQACAPALRRSSRPCGCLLQGPQPRPPLCACPAPPRPAGKVKVTAFDRLEASPPPPAGTCDALVFPACIAFHGLPLDQLPAAVVAALSGAAPPAGAAAEELQGTMLLVCCHAARDARCGHVGPPLAAKLAELAAQRGGGGSLRVLKSSHVGGHKVSGAGAGILVLRGAACAAAFPEPARDCWLLTLLALQRPAARPPPRRWLAC